MGRPGGNVWDHGDLWSFCYIYDRIISGIFRRIFFENGGHPSDYPAGEGRRNLDESGRGLWIFAVHIFRGYSICVGNLSKSIRNPGAGCFLGHDRVGQSLGLQPGYGGWLPAVPVLAGACRDGPSDRCGSGGFRLL